MRLLPLVLLLAFASASIGAETDKPAIPQPIPELKLTNGTVFRNVTIIRYDPTLVVLKSSAGTGPISYTMIPEPLRSTMFAERDKAKASATAAASKANAEALKKIEQDHAVAEILREHAAKIEAAIDKRQLMAGMTREQAVKSWGTPERKNTSGGTSGSREQWVYEKPGGTVYVYFEVGILTSWQTSESRR